MYLHYSRAGGRAVWIISDTLDSPPGYRYVPADTWCNTPDRLRDSLRVIVQRGGVEALQCEEAIVAYTLDRLMNHDRQG